MRRPWTTGRAITPKTNKQTNFFYPKPTDNYSSLEKDNSQGLLNPQQLRCNKLEPHILSARYINSTGWFYKIWASYSEDTEIKVSWDVTSCRLVNIYRYFEGPPCLSSARRQTNVMALVRHAVWTRVEICLFLMTVLPTVL